MKKVFRPRSPSTSAQSDVSVNSRPPFNVPVSHEMTGKSTMGATAITVVKESLQIVAPISGAFPPLQTVAQGLVEIFDRINAVKDVQIEAGSLQEWVEKLKIFAPSLRR